MILRKKELIAASLVILIGVAGYLNWSYQDTISVKDGGSYIETGKKLGEAQYVSSVSEVEDTAEKTEETAAEGDETATGDTAEETAAEDAAGGENAGETADGTNDSAVETVSDTGGYFEQARLDKETSRSKSLEILNQTASNESFDEEIRKKAGDKILSAAENVEKETAIESIAQSKGYAEICVYIEDDTANVSVRKDGFSQDDVAVLTDIITGQTDLGAQNIRIIEVK